MERFRLPRRLGIHFLYKDDENLDISRVCPPLGGVGSSEIARNFSVLLEVGNAIQPYASSPMSKAPPLRGAFEMQKPVWSKAPPLRGAFEMQKPVWPKAPPLRGAFEMQKPIWPKAPPLRGAFENFQK
jgi:hypothetical protein